MYPPFGFAGVRVFGRSATCGFYKTTERVRPRFAVAQVHRTGDPFDPVACARGALRRPSPYACVSVRPYVRRRPTSNGPVYIVGGRFFSAPAVVGSAIIRSDVFQTVARKTPGRDGASRIFSDKTGHEQSVHVSPRTQYTYVTGDFTGRRVALHNLFR